MIQPAFEKMLFDHIKNHLEIDFHSPVRIMNGVSNHIHILFLLNQNYALKDVLKNIKGESSHWLNQENLLIEKFSWQTGYGAFSVDESSINAVERYIENQKEHHRQQSYVDEVRELLKVHGFASEAKTVETVIEM